MAASLSLRVYTGSGAGVESASVAGIDLISADNATNSAGNRSANLVAPGTNSFEKWCRLKVDDADGQTVTGFWVERVGDLPAGVTIKFGVTDTPATPVVTASTVATREIATGRKWYFDSGAYDADGDYSRYIVFQEVVAADAADGSIDSQAIQFGWSAS